MELNWNLCIICQKETTEPVKRPLESHNQSGKADAYTSFLTNIQHFRDLDTLPASICFGSEVTAADFEAHSACWHKSCQKKFSNSKLERAKKKGASPLSQRVKEGLVSDREETFQTACSVTKDRRKVTSIWYQRLMLIPTFDP